MDEWQKDFSDAIKSVSEEVERFFIGMTEVVDTFIELTEEISEQVQSTLLSEVDQYLQDLAEPFLEVYWDFEDVLGDDLNSHFPYPVEATAETNPACIGCRNYHGQVYNGNLLVCGIHPHGWEDQSCPDWEQE
ncbi:MAG: hypothetical protein VKN72_00595 [Nostocales cyanobacterium 94392]|nr:hypothetical protein [Nostocales cyanobacterium 94392]